MEEAVWKVYGIRRNKKGNWLIKVALILLIVCKCYRRVVIAKHRDYCGSAGLYVLVIPHSSVRRK